MTQNLIKLGYTTKLVVVSKNNIDDLFSYQSSRRRIKNHHVTKLLKVLESGKGFPVLSVAKKCDGKYPLLDGNHRNDAFREFLEKNPDYKIEVLLAIYPITGEDAMKDQFRGLNDSVNISSDDLIQMYNKTPIISKLMTLPKVAIYKTANRPMNIRTLLTAYFDAVKPTFTASSYTGMKLIMRAEQLNASIAFAEIKAFLAEYQEVFGDLDKGSIFLRTTAINGFFRIWYQNKEKIPFAQMMSRFRKMANNSVVVIDTANGGAGATSAFVLNAVKTLNLQRGRGYGDFVIERDEVIA